MINLGNVVADSTIRIPFNSFDAAGASVTMSDFVAGDIKIYKDGGTTERSSTNGYTATTDFDGNTGMHVAVIDLSDNTDVGFYALNSAYDVAVDAVTIDGETVRFWVAKFEIQNVSVGSSGKQTGVQHFFSTETLTVPSWATSTFCGALGAGGGASSASGAGGGGYAEGAFDVKPGETLTISVGSGGTDSGGETGDNTTITGSISGLLVTGNGGTGNTGTGGAAGGTGTGGDFQASGGDGGLWGGNTTSRGGGGGAGTRHGDGGNGGTAAVNGTGGGGGTAGGNGGTLSGAAAAGGGFGGSASGATAGSNKLASIISANAVGLNFTIPLTWNIPQGAEGVGGTGGNDGESFAGGGGSANGGLFGGGGGSTNLPPVTSVGHGGLGAGGGGAGSGGDGYAFVQFFG